MILELLWTCGGYMVGLTDRNSVLELPGLTSENKSLAELLTLPRQPVSSAASARPTILVCLLNVLLLPKQRTNQPLAAKLALVGLTETLAKEGLKYNIHSNAIAPIGKCEYTITQMTIRALLTTSSC